jgi:hypothetical protein
VEARNKQQPSRKKTFASNYAAAMPRNPNSCKFIAVKF